MYMNLQANYYFCIKKRTITYSKLHNIGLVIDLGSDNFILEWFSVKVTISLK